MVAALATLAIAEGQRSRPPIVDSVRISESFSPPGEARISFRLTEDEPRADLLVVARRGSVTRALVAGEPLGDYEIHEFRWDGGKRGGALARPGTYRVRLRLREIEREVPLGKTRLRAGGGRR